MAKAKAPEDKRSGSNPEQEEIVLYPNGKTVEEMIRQAVNTPPEPKSQTPKAATRTSGKKRDTTRGR